jgi:hypothetical protein
MINVGQKTVVEMEKSVAIIREIGWRLMRLRLLMIIHGAHEYDFGLDFSINQKIDAKNVIKY